MPFLNGQNRMAIGAWLILGVVTALSFKIWRLQFLLRIV